MILLSVAYISTITYVAWKDLSYLGFVFIDFAVKDSVWSHLLYLYWWISKTRKNLEFSSIQKIWVKLVEMASSIYNQPTAVSFETAVSWLHIQYAVFLVFLLFSLIHIIFHIYVFFP